MCYLGDCGNTDAVVVVDETPGMAAKIAMSNGRTKVAFLAGSAIKQEDSSNAVGGALQHAIIMRYMLEDDQMEQGVTGAPWDTQEEGLLRGIPLWVLDSNRGHEGHQKVHGAGAAQEQIVSEAPVDKSEANARKPTPTLPKLRKTAQVIPTGGTAARKGTRSSSKKQGKEQGKESDKTEESYDDHGDEEEEDYPEQVLETRPKQKRAPHSHFDANPDDSGKDQPKKKAKTAASASAEFNPPSRSGSQPSPGTVASWSGGSSVARSLNSRLAKVTEEEVSHN